MAGTSSTVERFVTDLPAQVWTTDTDLRITYTHESSSQTLGLHEGDVIGITSRDCFLGDPPAANALEAMKHALAGERSAFRTTWEGRSFYARVEPLRDENDHIVGTVGAALDVSAETSDRAFEGGSSLLETAQTLVHLGTWSTDLATGATTVSREFERIAGRTMGVTTLDDIVKLVHQGDRATFEAAFERAKTEGSRYDVQHRVVRPDGSVREVRAQGAFEIDGGRAKRVIGTWLDVTDQMKLDRVLSKMTYHDQLTGLPNDTLLRDRLTRAIARSRRNQTQLAVMAIELDHFADVADTLGPSVADRLLIEIGRRLGETVRPTDTIARRGAEHFSVLLPDLREPSQATAFLRRMRDRLREPLHSSLRDLRVTASVGIALYPWDGEDGEGLLRSASSALHRSIESGPDGFRYFSDSMHAAVIDRLTLDQDLRVAIEAKVFRLDYQPMVDFASGEICGWEALLRWPRSGAETATPAQFVARAEENGLIDPLGDFAMTTALSQVGTLIAHGSGDVRLGINVSARQFLDPMFVSRIRRILEESKVDPRVIELELTESALLRDLQTTRSTLHELRMLGVGVAIDDFGTGYNSLFYLKSLPVTTLKLDICFVADIGVDPNSEAIILSVVALAHRLGLRVVAEGVETDAQYRFLLNSDCDAYQGFHFSPAVPLSECRALLTGARPPSV
jgi:diguanylate cyclase (GGDEF)-like protein/PAS domain S-box-containing protein